LLLVCLPAMASGAEWEHQDDAEGEGYAYAIYAKESGSGRLVYRAVGHIERGPEVVEATAVRVATDPSRAPRGQTRTLLESGDEGFLVYSYIDLPMVTDRDIVSRGVRGRDADGSLRIDWSATEDPRAPLKDEDVIRMTDSYGHWKFSPDGAGGTDVRYETTVDLGGSLPGWLVDPLMQGTVADSFESLAREALAAP
jgi:hypothetical protein